jgi:serine/threonine-protein kinase
VPSSRDSGERIGNRYELIRQLAKGGMAAVWEAEDTILARPVAVKILLPHLAADEQFVERFRREAVAAARLSHPHIVAIYDTCATDDCEAIVMELVRGRTLRAALDEIGALPVRQAVDIATQVADALHHAHVNGLIHRDVKPGNILLSDDGRVLVTDFGIAKAAEAASELTEVGLIVGTAKYLAPEQVQGQPLDARADVYSLGIVLYEMLTGRVPFAGENSTSTALARVTTTPLRPRQIRAGIPRAVEDVVMKAMAVRREERYQSAAELRAALVELDLARVDGDDETSLVRATQPGADPTPPPAEHIGFVRSERRWLVPVALILVVAVVLGIVGVVVGGTDVGDRLFGGSGSTATTGALHPIAIARARSFDPQGDGAEHDESIGNLLDNDAATVWSTEHYNARTFGTKKGVGVVLSVASPQTVRSVTIDSATTGWRASIYVADTPRDTLPEWGAPVATVSGAGTVTLGKRAGAVLVWITDLGPSNQVDISRIALNG